MCKIILVGNNNVGKSSIISKYVENDINENSLNTFTSDKYKKIIEIKDEKIELDIWDTVAQENYRSVNRIFMKNAEIAILVYDITNRKSFEDLEFWYNQVIKSSNDSIVVLAIAANKSDLYEEQVVDFEEGKEFAQKKCITIIRETTSFDFDNINNFFEEILLEYIKKKHSNDNQNENNINYFNDENNNKKEKSNFYLMKPQKNEIFQSYNKNPTCVYV
jgi:Ras-related protein Rab-6A